jgi:methyl-accepting chemotaxis protein/methyl-accepting chemotaxis protein-1 (serine sensor receptor)
MQRYQSVDNSQIPVTTRIAFLVGCLAVAMILASLVSFRSTSKLSQALTHIANVSAAKTDLASRISDQLSQASAARRSLVLEAMLTNPAGVDTQKQRLQLCETEVDRAVEEYALLATPDEKPALRELQNRVGSLKSLNRQMTTLLVNQQMDVTLKLQSERISPEAEQARELIARITAAQRANLERAGDEAERTAEFSSWTLIGFIALSVVLSAVAALFLRGINRDFRRVAANLASDATQVAGAATRVREVSKLLAQGASDQAASLEETAASIEEITSATRLNSESSETASNLSQQATQLLATANHKLDGMMTSMRAINDSSEKISKIIHIIDEIAFQTNILALNAAVEAARAGDAGMGFAVVADEVRNLAQRSAQAAKDTSTLIEDSIRSSREGRERVNELVESMRVVTDNTTRSNELNAQVNSSCAEQARGISQISHTVIQMQKVTSDTAGSAEEVASAGEEMADLSNTLHTAIMRFRSMVGADSEVDTRIEGRHLARHSA